SGETPVVSSSSVTLEPGIYETLTTANAKPGWGSRYWDGCKPHCAWRENVDTTANPFSICKNCNFDNEEIAAFTLSPDVSIYWTGYAGTKNSCDGGVAYACFDMAPLALNDTLAYAFVATSKANASCGQCFQVQFDGGAKYGIKEAHGLLKGKTLIVMASNTGSDVDAGQFDIMIPGGGVGIYNSFSNQVGVSSATLGEQYGGLLTMCQKEINNYDAPAAEFKTCVTNKCNAIFGSNDKFSDLLRGCLWFAEWFEAADNPTYLYKPIECPAYFKNKYPSTINTNKDNTIPASTY
ncbi:MAG: glycosyl hydrolase family 5, partial [Fibrobacteraceae bacterium]